MEVGEADQECRADARDGISEEEASAKGELADDGVGVQRLGAWMADESACSCTKCDEPFTLFRRRHHCWACGRIYCAECAPRTRSAWSSLLSACARTVPTFKRLCEDCAQGLASSPQGPALPGTPHVKNTFIDVIEESLGFGNKLSDSCPF